MVNKQDINEEAKIKLIEIYSKYIKDPSNEKIQDSAMEIHQEYGNAIDSLLNEEISEAVGKTASMSFGELSKKEANEILKSLSEIKKIEKENPETLSRLKMWVKGYENDLDEESSEEDYNRWKEKIKEIEEKSKKAR